MIARRHHNRRAVPVTGKMEGAASAAPTRAPLTERSRCGIHGLPTGSGRCAACDIDQGKATSLCGSCKGTKRMWNPNSKDYEPCSACEGLGVR